MALEQEIQQKINEAIDKDLSKVVGERLKKRLDEANELENKVETLLSDQKNSNDKIKNLEKQIAQLNRFKDIEHRLKDERKNLDEEIAKFKFNELKAENERLIANNQFHQGILNSLVRNVEYRNSIFGSRDYITPDQYGNSVFNTLSNNYEETKKAE